MKTPDKIFFVLTEPLSAQARGYLVLPDAEHANAMQFDELASYLAKMGLSARNLIIAIPAQESLQLFIDAPQIGTRQLGKALYWAAEPLSSIPLEEQMFFWRWAPTGDRPRRCLVTLVELSAIEEWRSCLHDAKLSDATLISINQLFQTSGHREALWQNWYFAETNEGLATVSRSYLNDREIPLVQPFPDKPTGQNTISLDEIIDATEPGEYINLGAPNLSRESWKELVQPRALGLSLAVCTLVLCLYFVGMGQYLHAQAQELESQAISAYKQWFPEDSRIVNVERQLQGKLNQQERPAVGEISGKIDSIARSIEQSLGTYKVERIRYQSSNGSFQLVLILEQMDDLTKLEKIMESRRFDFTVQSATRRSSGLEVGLIMTPYGA